MIESAAGPPGPVRHRRFNRGSLLIEVVVALTIFLLAVVILFSTLVSGQLVSTTNKDRHRALQDARSLLEQMSIIPLPSIGQVFPHDTEIPEFQDLHLRDQRVRVRYDNANAAAVPLGYEVVSTWTTVHGRPATMVLRGGRSR